VERIAVIPDASLEEPGVECTLGSNVKIFTKTKGVYERLVKAAPGMPENPLTDEEHREHFKDCMNYARKPLSVEKSNQIVSTIGKLEDGKDVRSVISLLT